MQVWAQGCPTLYKSQVILSIKDTPLVPKLCIKAEHDGILSWPPVILLPTTDLLEPVGGVERSRRGVRLAPLEVDVPDAAGGQCFENVSYEGSAQAGAPTIRSHGEAQDLALVGGLDRHDVADDCVGPAALGDEKMRVGGHAVAKVLRGPRVGENLLLDRADRRDIAEFSGTNLVGVGRSAPPISLEPRRAGRT